MADSEEKFNWYDQGSWAAPGPHKPASLNEDSPQGEDAHASTGKRERIRMGLLGAIIAALFFV